MNSVLPRRSVLRLAAAAATPTLAAPGVFAQAWPTRPVQIVVPSAPGGAVGNAARILAPALARRWKQAVTLEYIPGDGNVKGTLALVRSSPDGHRLGLATSALSINAALKASLPYSTLVDLAPISELAHYEFAIVAQRGIPVHSAADLIAYVKRSPTPVLYAAPGMGTGAHLAAESFAFEAEIGFRSVQFDSVASAENAVLAGHLPFAVVGLTSNILDARQRPLQLVCLMGARRGPGTPGVSWVSDALPGFEVDGSIGAVAPAGVPRAVQQQLGRDFAAVVQQADVRESFARIAMACTGTTPSQYEAQIRADIAQWRLAGRIAGIKLG